MVCRRRDLLAGPSRALFGKNQELENRRYFRRLLRHDRSQDLPDETRGD